MAPCRTPIGLVLPLAVALAALVLPGRAHASELIDRNATAVKLQVNHDGIALLTYRKNGRVRRVLAWGAVDGRAPSRSRPQVAFRLDYSGGWGTFHRPMWRGFRNACRPYDGPKLAWFVLGCKAADGSYWTVQSWQRMLPNLGYTPWKPEQRVWELRLAHWTGPMAKIEAWTDWIYGGRYHALFGRLTYRGVPVHGFTTTNAGAPLDSYGRNLYLDSFDSAYGRGWRRENSFVAHNPMGVFCYGFFEFEPYSGYPRRTASRRGHGSKYRMTVIGPGVSPDVTWQGDGLPEYDRRNPHLVAHEAHMNAMREQVLAGDPLCRQR